MPPSVIAEALHAVPAGPNRTILSPSTLSKLLAGKGSQADRAAEASFLAGPLQLFMLLPVGHGAFLPAEFDRTCADFTVWYPAGAAKLWDAAGEAAALRAAVRFDEVFAHRRGEAVAWRFVQSLQGKPSGPCACDPWCATCVSSWALEQIRRRAATP